MSRGTLPPGDRRLWLLIRSIALRIELRSTNIWIFEIFYRRLVLVLAGLGLVLWLVAATALFVWLDRTPHNKVTWFDLAAPWRWSGLKAKRGDTAIETAIDQFNQRDIANAFFNLRAGVARSPGNVEGRLLLMRFQAPYDPVRGVALMEEGIAHSYDNPRFLTALFTLYAVQQIQTHALETAETILSGKYGKLSPESRFILVKAQASLLIQLGRFSDVDQALASVAATTSEQRLELQQLRIDSLLRSGQPKEALKLSQEIPSTSSTSMRQAVDIAVALEDSDALQSALRQLKANSPVEPGPYLMTIQAWQRLKRGTYRDAAEGEYYRLFGTRDAALQAIASLGVNLDLPEIVVRAQQNAASARLSTFAFRVHLTEMALRRGDSDQAMRSLRDWENTIETLANAQRFYPEFIKRLTRAAFSGTADQMTYLITHLSANRPQANIAVYNLAVSVLRKTGNLAAADQLLKSSVALFPQSDPLLLARKQLDAEIALAATETEKKAASTTAVQIAVPPKAETAISQLEKMIADDQLTAARDLLRAIRSQKPAWLDASESAISAYEVELSLLTVDQLASRGQIRTYLGRFRSEDDVMRLVDFVPKLIAGKREAVARMLYDELMAMTNSPIRVQRALRELNISDDLAVITATQAKTLAALDGWILNEEWAQAERSLKYLREKPPAWFSNNLSDIKVREILVRLGLDQRPRALTVFKELVIKPGESRSAAFALVRLWMNQGRQEIAQTFAREVVRLLPDDPAAGKLLKETDAPAVLDAPPSN